MGSLVTTLLYIPQTDIYTVWCDPYVTFCLFSEGRANSLAEAQHKCKEIKEKSWPVELIDGEIVEVFVRYVRNNSISDVILNAVKEEGFWRWVSGKDVESGHTHGTTIIDEFLIYDVQSPSRGFRVVCATVNQSRTFRDGYKRCYANWTYFYGNCIDQQAKDNFSHFSTQNQCKENCEKDANCSSVDWNFGFVKTCVLYVGLCNVSIGFLEGTHHVVDRSVKNVGTCVGDYKGRPLEFNWVSLPIFFFVLSISIFTFSVSPLCREKVQFFGIADHRPSEATTTSSGGITSNVI